MLFGVFFAFWRFMEIITLIPTMGMLAYFVHIYASADALTPDDILVLFIVSVLALAWAIGTLFTYHRSRNNSRFVAFIDLLFVGAFIGGVYTLRYIASQKCSNLSWGSPHTISGEAGSLTVNGLNFSADKQCAMKKAAFAFGIMNIIFFFITSVLAFFHNGEGKESRKEKTYVRETHSTRHRRSGSHRSHRSEHSGRRHAYV